MGRRTERLIYAAVYLVALAANLGFLTVLSPAPTGDEPHYLLYAQSLAEDHDLALSNDYASPERVAKTFDGPLGTLSHARVFKEGEPIRPIHGPGLPVLLAPVMAAGGTWFSVRVALGVLTAAALPVLVSILFALGRRRWRDVAIALVVAVSYPYAVYATQIYPDTVAVLLVLVGVRACLAPARSPWRWVGMGASVVLPWFHVRFIPLAAGIAAGLLLGAIHRTRPPAGWRARLGWAARAALPAGAPMALSLLALLAYHARIYGEASFLAAYRDFPPTATGEISAHHLYTYSFGDLFSRQYGILPVAPLYLAGLVGLGLAVRRWRWGALLAVGAALAYYLPTSMKSFNGGFCPPGRFTVPVLILLALPLSLVIERRLWVAPAAVLGLASLAFALQVARGPYSSLYPDPSTRQWPVVADRWSARAFPITPESIYPRSAVLTEGTDRAVAPTDGAGTTFVSGPIPVLSPAAYIAAFDLEVGQGAVRLEIARRGTPLASSDVAPTARTTRRLRFGFPPGSTDLDARVSTVAPSTASVHGVVIREAPHPRPLWHKSLAWLGALIVGGAVVAWAGGPRPRSS